MNSSIKRLFSNPQLVKELIEGFVQPEIASLLDFSSLEKVEGSFITPAMKEREGDLIWKIKADQTTLYIYLLLEFQSTVNYAMPVRMMQYISALYDSLIQQKHQDLADGLPPVLPIVLYNGDNKWTAKTSTENMMPAYPKALEPYQVKCQYLLIDENTYIHHPSAEIKSFVAGIFSIETAKTPDEFRAIIQQLHQLAHQHPELTIVIDTISQWLGMRMKHKFPNLPFQEVNLKEERTMLETNMERWKQDWIDQGISQGISQGITQGISQGITQGISQGITQGINKGKAMLLQQMITMKFPSADLSPYQHAIADAAEDELMQYSKKLFTATCVSEIFE